MPLRVQSRTTTPPKKASGQAPAASKGLPFNLPQPPAGTKQLPPGVSLCMIVKNEERYMEQCLRSVAGHVDEICIIDSGSTDATVAIAEKFGARVERREWRDDFAWARNEALAMATKRWILVLDADEELGPECGASLNAIGKLPAGTTALYVRCDNLSDDYKGTGSISHLIARIFPNHPDIRFISPVHEYISHAGDEMGCDTRLSDVNIIHHGYLQDVVTGRNKAERNFALIRRATELHPDNAFHWYNLGMTAHVVKDYEQAIVAFEKMREILGGRPRAFLPQALVTLGECYADGRNDDERAMSIIQEAVAASPQLTNAHFSLGRILQKMGRREEAREAYERAIEAKAYRHIQFIVDDQIYEWKAQHLIGVTYSDEKRFEEAIEWYRRGLANQPNVQPLLINLAHALEGAGRYDEAEAAFAGVREHFDDETSVVQQINFLLRRRKYPEALRLMEETERTVSARTAATFMVAAAQMAQRAGDKDAELAHLRKANQRDPAAGPVLDALEAFYRSSGDAAALEELYENEFKYEPVETYDFVRRSFRFIALERYEEAAAVAAAGLKKAPTDQELRYNSAVARVKLGDIAGALEDLRVIPSGPAELPKKGALLRATLLRDQGGYEAALDAIRSSFADGLNVDAAMICAQCQERLGRIDDALEALESVFGDDRQRVGIEIASLYMRAGRFADAQRAAERALAPA